MSKPLKFYYDLMSQPARALYIFLKVTNIPFESCPIALRKGDHLTDEYKKNVNRFSKVPCINDNGFQLTESIAILKYLVASNDSTVADHWYPKDIKQRARVDEYLEWQHLGTRMGCSTYFVLKWLLPLRTGKQTDEKRLAESRKQMESTLDIIENLWLKDRKFIAGGNNISIADIMAACEIEQTTIADYNPLEGRPKLTEWLKLIKKTTYPHYDEATKFVYIAAGNKPKL